MKTVIIYSLLFLGLISWSLLSAQEVHPIFQDRSYTFSGQVKTMAGELLPDVSIKVRETSQGMNSDTNGFFAFTLKMGIYHFEISHVGYKTLVLPVELRLNLSQVIRLEESLEILDEVTITEGGGARNVQAAEQGVARLNVERIKQLPRLLGESDVIRSVQTLPGVTSVGEGATGFNVRGGNADQNLILLDDIPLFNAAHLIGLYSSINPDMLRDVTLYRGGMPARYGSRASSVLDARLREPARDRLHVKGSAGLIASRILAEGPLIRDKWFLGVGGRVSYADYLFRSVLKPAYKETEANFSELTLKSVFKPNAQDQLSLTVFLSADAFRLAGDSLSTLEVNATSTRFKWTNSGASLKWNTFFTEEWGLSILGAISRYRPGFNLPGSNNGASFESQVIQSSIQTELKHYGKNQESSFGIQTAFYGIQPGSLRPDNPQSAINANILPEENGRELVLFLSNDWTISEKVRLSTGLRWNGFANLGPAQVFQYQDPAYIDQTTLSDTIHYEKGQRVRQFSGLEPRFSLRVNALESASLKLGYQRAYQYLHLISNTTSALPTDRWKLSDTYLDPQIADQISLGWFQNFRSNTLEASVEFFYKRIENMPDYRSGVSLLMLRNPETAILQGLGRAYGVELSLQKKGVRLEGMLNYTYSQAEIHVISPYPEDRFLSGTYYPTNFNRPHLLNIQARYRLNKRIVFSGNFTYQSGRASTLPEDRYEIGNFFLPNFTSRNDSKTPDFHRLDIGLTVEPDPRKDSRYKDRWVFSLYNVYAHKNPYSLFVETINDRPLSTSNRAKIYQLSIIGSIVPSISYEFEF